jgi:hypothetical protein
MLPRTSWWRTWTNYWSAVRNSKYWSRRLNTWFSKLHTQWNRVSTDMKRHATQIRRDMWWRNKKMLLLLILVVLIIIYVILIISCGGFALKRCTWRIYNNVYWNQSTSNKAPLMRNWSTSDLFTNSCVPFIKSKTDPSIVTIWPMSCTTRT